ncbi:hypothetical protein VW23_014260 [Devosia insulae DS-56]|uniref:SnoaL-like domain-containing protein n=1 Tax=Devosia insulae DS-56 TaxID=1116389 RepID=A0A1E5XTB8_9HYPH|nr:hypothetical protein [Devosia insulae]OEO31836.1 hypothetical protein VW23_014260 [Devosia insulae DS-56]
MSETNPFAAADADRFAIWEMLVRRDSDFFLSSDFSLVAADYVETGFLGIDAALSLDPANWRPAYSDLATYRDAAIAARWNPREFAEPLRPAWFRCQSIDRIDINGDAALAHKRIDGQILRQSGDAMLVAWRSVFHLRREHGAWKIAGFTGYLPL